MDLIPIIVFPSKQTLLHLAAQSGQVAHLDLLIERGAQIDAQDLSKKTPSTSLFLKDTLQLPFSSYKRELTPLSQELKEIRFSMLQLFMGILLS